MKSVFRMTPLLLLVGCGSTGVVSIGPDTYMVGGSSATGFHSGASVTAELYREANAFCASQQRQLMPVNVQAVDGRPGYAFANSKLEFRCLDAGDPELRRPAMQPAPDIRIEQTIKQR